MPDGRISAKQDFCTRKFVINSNVTTLETAELIKPKETESFDCSDYVPISRNDKYRLIYILFKDDYLDANDKQEKC